MISGATLIILMVCIWILGISAIAGIAMGKIWGNWQNRQRHWFRQSLPFMLSGSVASLAGFVVGYEIGYRKPVDCDIGVIGCGLEQAFNSIVGGIVGTLAGATMAVVGLAIALWLITLVSQR